MNSCLIHYIIYHILLHILVSYNFLYIHSKFWVSFNVFESFEEHKCDISFKKNQIILK